MPVYEYKCKKCGDKFEIRRSLQEKETEPECPGCGACDAQRKFSVFGGSCSTGSAAPAPPRFKFG